MNEVHASYSLPGEKSGLLTRLFRRVDDALHFNAAWMEFSGKTHNQLAGANWLDLVHADDKIKLVSIDQSIERQDLYSIEYRVRRFDGSFRSVIETGMPYREAGGKYLGYLATCRDITDLREAENELQTQAKELKRSNEELEQFAYVASHDLQEPLRMVASYIQLIQKNIHKGNVKDVDEFMKFVLDGVSRMQALINDLLQFSRVSRKGTPFTEVDLNETLHIALEHLKARIAETSADVRFDPMPVVVGDNFQLIRLFQNLIDNALKFKSPERQPKVKISVEERNDCYAFCVCDNGIGIEPKFFQRIFVIFQKLHNRNEYAGTGIGLAVCKKIVERHGGEIWVESEVGKGTDFRFTLRK